MGFARARVEAIARKLSGQGFGLRSSIKTEIIRLASGELV